MKAVLSYLTLCFIISSFLTSCSTPEIEGKTEAEKLYKEAQTLVKNGRFLLATEKLNIIRSKYPYSYYATFAELMGADVLFEQQSYAEAAAAYIVFKDYHPRHEKLPYVLGRIGDSFYKQIPDTFDRDLAPAFESIKYYNFLIRSFPNSEYIGNAKERIAEAEAMIRNKEKYIADFYFKTKVYEAARYRYVGILDRFKDKDLINHSAVRILMSSTRMGDSQFCRKNYPSYLMRVTDKQKKNLKFYFEKCISTTVKKEKGDDVEKL